MGRGIKATPIGRRGPKDYGRKPIIVETENQGVVETIMSHLGYGCCDYFLSFVEIKDENPG